MVELVLVEVEAADQRVDGAVARVEGDEGAFHLGQLGDFPGVLGRLRHPDHGAAADLDLGRRLVGQPGLRRPQALAGDLEGARCSGAPPRSSWGWPPAPRPTSRRRCPGAPPARRRSRPPAPSGRPASRRTPRARGRSAAARSP